MKVVMVWVIFFIAITIFLGNANAQPSPHKPTFSVLILYENGGHHLAYTNAAIPWLNQLAADSNFSINYIQNTNTIDDELLKKYQLFIQLDYPPYGWKEQAVQAFQRYIAEGRGGWIGFHHAALLGQFDGYPMWQWFSVFMGDIIYKNYIPTFASATVKTEDALHPVMKNLPSSFKIDKEEWYTFNKSPRPNVQVIASVDESSYEPGTDIKMGDHPVMWTNLNFKARNLYVFMGHAPELFNNIYYTTIFRNAIFWAAAKK
jgi:type 1 glutamine amidotransferase